MVAWRRVGRLARSIASRRLVNDAFSLSRPCRHVSSAGGVGPALAPVSTPPRFLAHAASLSNEVVSVAFRQHIGPTQALRTGAYSKTLAFTLSTTTP